MDDLDDLCVQGSLDHLCTHTLRSPRYLPPPIPDTHFQVTKITQVSQVTQDTQAAQVIRVIWMTWTFWVTWKTRVNWVACLTWVTWMTCVFWVFGKGKILHCYYKLVKS